jgi:hypothetical protein
LIIGQQTLDKCFHFLGHLRQDSIKYPVNESVLQPWSEETSVWIAIVLVQLPWQGFVFVAMQFS